MNNPFENLKDRHFDPLQIRDEYVVAKPMRGRPRKPNMKKYMIKMDMSLHKQLVKRAEEKGCSRSCIIAESLRSYFAK